MKSIPLVTILLLAGCHSAPNSVRAPENQIDVSVAGAGKSLMTNQVQQSAEALHNYLIGELTLNQENFSAAQDRFQKASELSKEPIPRVHVKLAELLIESGDHYKALEETQHALDSDRDNSNIWLLRGGILEALGRFDEARELYKSLEQKDADLIEAPVFYAAICAHKGDLDLGIAELKPKLEKHPKDTTIRFLLGQLYEGQGKFDQAFEAYKSVQKLTQGSDPISLDMIRVLIKGGKVDRLVKLYEEHKSKKVSNPLLDQLLKKLDPKDDSAKTILIQVEAIAPGDVSLSDVRFKMALKNAQAQQFTRAALHLTMLLASDPNYELARYYRASMYAGAGRKKEAIKDLDRIKPDQELYIKACTFASFLLRQDGDLAGAEKYIRAALKVEPENKLVFSNLILLLRDEKKFKEAEKLIEVALKNDPKDERNLYNLAIIKHEAGDNNAALENMEKIISINPQNTDALNYIAYALADSGKDLDRAEELVTRALAISADDAFYLDTLGWIYFKRGNFDRASDILKRAASLSGNDVVVLDHYGDALSRAGNPKDAYQAYRIAVEKARDAETGKNTHDTAAIEKGLRSKLEKKLDELVSKFPEVAGDKP